LITEKMDPNDQTPATPDAPDKETMEQIRRRRLAKLGGPPAPVPAETTSSSSAPSSSQPAKPETERRDAGAEQSSSIETRPTINISPAPPAPAATPQSVDSSASGITDITDTRAKRRASEIDGPAATAPPRKQTPLHREETFEEYTDRILGAIFRVTVDPDRTTDSHGRQFTFLPNLHQELQDEGLPLRLDASRLEQIIMEAGTEFQHDRPLFDYLLACWKRVVKTLKMLRGPAPQKEALLKEAKRLCFSNCIFALTMPELFGYGAGLLYEESCVCPLT
jgi:ubiquitin conjugation factor E4 B